MISRAPISIATLLLVAASVGCDDNKPADNKYGAKTGSTGAAKPSASGSGSAAPTGSGSAKAGDAKPAAEGKSTIKGTVKLAGNAPEMKVPKKRKDAEICKEKEVKYNAVVADKGGHLQDVLIAIADGQINGDFKAAKPAEVHQKDCMYAPRIQGILPAQEVAIFNDDATLHNVHAYHGADSPINQAQPKGSAPIKSTKFEEPGIYRMQCDVHPWMRAFVIASDNPFNGVSGADGSFKIEKVPAGKYTINAWHAMYGKLEKKDVEIKDGDNTVDFEFTGKEIEPAENAGELKDLW